MTQLKKYSTKRKIIRMSLNKYNIFNIRQSFKRFRRRGKRASLYKNQFSSKQQLKLFYGGIREKMFKKYFNEGSLYKGLAIDNFFILLEKRLDVVVYRLGWAKSIFMCRQLICHGHIMVNNKKVNISSYRLKKGDIIEPTSEGIEIIKSMMMNLWKFSKRFILIPNYLEVNNKILVGVFIRSPIIKEIYYPKNINIKLINQFYKKN